MSVTLVTEGKLSPSCPLFLYPSFKENRSRVCLCCSMERRETVTCPQPDFVREVPCPKVDRDAGKEEKKVAGRTQGLRQGEDLGKSAA